MISHPLAHTHVAPGAFLLLAYLDPECRGDVRYDFAWIAQWLDHLGIKVHRIMDTAPPRPDFVRVQLGETITLALMYDEDRVVVDVLDLTYALYEYCFGEEVPWRGATSRHNAMQSCMATFERHIMASFELP
jgi:hypothetical protein